MRKINSVFLLAVLVLAGCQTVPTSISTNLSPQEYFQKAQSYSDQGNYKAARFYYDTFMQRYPNDQQRIAEAQYEIAFIYYKLHEYPKSKELFTQLVNRYKAPGGDALPRWPLVLSNKLLIVIDGKLRPKGAQAATAAENAATPASAAPTTETPPAPPAATTPATPPTQGNQGTTQTGTPGASTITAPDTTSPASPAAPGGTQPSTGN